MCLVNEATIMDITYSNTGNFDFPFDSMHNLNFTRYFIYFFRYRRLIPKYLSNYFLNDRWFVRVKIKNTRKLFKNYKCNKNKNIKHYNISQRIPFASKRLSLPPPPSPFRKDRSRGSDLFSNYLRPARNALTSRYSPPLHTPDRERERENNIIPFNFTKSKINFSQSRTKYDEITNFRSALYEVTE